MISIDYKKVYCDGFRCHDYVDNYAWGHIKADGWFFQKDGYAYCPKHIPEWVEAWRAKKSQTKN